MEMQAKQYEEQVIEMQPMLDTAVQPPLLEVRRGRASPSKPQRCRGPFYAPLSSTSHSSFSGEPSTL